MIDNESGIKYTGPWAVYYFLNYIGLFLLGIAINWVFPIGLALFGVKLSGHSLLLRTLAFILSMPISYFFFQLAISSYLLPQIKKISPNTYQPPGGQE
jgi:hypothetical protein